MFRYLNNLISDHRHIAVEGYRERKNEREGGGTKNKTKNTTKKREKKKKKKRIFRVEGGILSADMSKGP